MHVYGIIIKSANNSDTYQEHGAGAFREFPQVEAARLYTKFTARPNSLEQLPAVLSRAYRQSICGRPGGCYIDLPGDLITAECPVSVLREQHKLSVYTAPRSMADDEAVKQACQLLSTACRPLVIIGKGSAYADNVGSVLLQFIERYNLPFIAMPMAKGLLPDRHQNNVAAARSLALQRADVAIIFGGRLNWQLHFGKQPRWSTSIKVITVDLCYEEAVSTPPGEPERFSLIGDIPLVARQMLTELQSMKYKGLATTADSWWQDLASKCRQNQAIIEEMMRDDRLPMTYYRAFAEIRSLLPEDVFIVSEGANTMDIGRTVLYQQLPRSRLDAGTFGTMGVGVGYAIAAKLTHPDRPVVCIQGDSAFGFSAMELETVARLRLPILFIIINNSGIYSGLDQNQFQLLHSQHASFSSSDGGVKVVDLPSTALLPNARYERIAEAFGGLGVCVQSPDELKLAVARGLKLAAGLTGGPFVINCLIEVGGKRRPQSHSWLTRRADTKSLL